MKKEVKKAAKKSSKPTKKVVCAEEDTITSADIIKALNTKTIATVPKSFNLIRGLDQKEFIALCSRIEDTIYAAKGLTIEVLSSAFLYLKENPGATIESALMAGESEWLD